MGFVERLHLSQVSTDVAAVTDLTCLLRRQAHLPRTRCSTVNTPEVYCSRRIRFQHKAAIFCERGAGQEGQLKQTVIHDARIVSFKEG